MHLLDFSLLINWTSPFVKKGRLVYLFVLFFFCRNALNFCANSVDSDQMQHFASDMGLHGLRRSFLTLKAPNKNCSSLHFNFLLLSLEENKA